MGVKRALWDLTPLQQPTGGRDCLGFSFQSQRGFCLWLCSGGVLRDPAQRCLHFC